MGIMNRASIRAKTAEAREQYQIDRPNGGNNPHYVIVGALCIWDRATVLVTGEEEDEANFLTVYFYNASDYGRMIREDDNFTVASENDIDAFCNGMGIR